jgi:Flp pilus assembly protein TadD
MSSEQAQEAFDAALNAHDGGDVELAEAKYREALTADPSMTVAHNNLGMVLIQQERLDEAVAPLQQAVLQDPQYAEAYNNLGFAFRRLGRDMEAASQYEKFLALTPDVAEGPRIREWVDKVRIEANAADEAAMPPAEALAPEAPAEVDAPPAFSPAEAEADAQQPPPEFAVAVPPPDDGASRPGAGTAPVVAKAPPTDQELAEFFDSDIVSGAAGADQGAAPGPGGEGQSDDGLSDKAEAEFADMFGDSPLAGGQGDAAAAAGGEEVDEEIGQLYTEAMTKFQDGDMGESARYCSMVMEKSPQHFPTLLLGGRVALSRQDYTRATALLQKALEVRADEPEVYYFLGQCYEKRGLLDEAQEVYKKCLDVSPDGPRAKRLAEWLKKQRADSTVGQGQVRCELCLRTVSEDDVSDHEGRRVCKNCLETLGARQEEVAKPGEKDQDDKSDRRVVVPRRRSSPMLVVLLLLVLLGAGGYVGAVYMDFVKGPEALEDLLGKKPLPVKPVNPIKRNGPVVPKTRKISPKTLELAAVTVKDLQPLESLSMDLAARVRITWPGKKPQAPANAEEIKFVLLEGPDGMTVEPTSGLLTWTPGLTGTPREVLREHQVSVQVTCGKKEKQVGFAVTVSYSLRTPREVDVQLRATYRSAAAHLGLVFADFDGDGQPDLAAGCGNALGGKLRIMLSAGGSSEFSKAPHWTLKSAPVGLAAADLDGDGRTDLGWASWIGGQLQMLRGMARRAPLKPVRVADTRSLADAMTLADLDGDGRVDLVVANSSLGKLSSHKARGGKLAEIALIPSGLPPQLFALKSAGSRADRVGLVLSGGAGAGKLFLYSLRRGKLVRDQVLELPKGIIKCVRSGDFDGDGKADAALLYGGKRGVLAVLSGADPKKMSLLEPVPVGELPLGMEVGEINGDGRADLVLAGPESVKVLLSCGRGRFMMVGSTRILGLASPVALWPTRDGKPARAAVLNLKGRAWVLTMPPPLKVKPKKLKEPASDGDKGGQS